MEAVVARRALPLVAKVPLVMTVAPVKVLVPASVMVPSPDFVRPRPAVLSPMPAPEKRTAVFA